VSATTTYLPAAAQDGEPPRRWRQRTVVLLVCAATVVVAAGLTWLLAFSSVFGAGTVQVRGTHVLSAGTVRRTADVAAGTPLLRLDTAAITRRVERLPDVASAQVSTSFPTTVVITVVERRPVGYLRSGGHDVLVDRTGAAYRASTTPPAGAPRFVVAGGAAARPTRRAVATVAAALPATLRAQVRSVQALDPSSVTLVLRDDRIVRWGSTSRTADKARILPLLLKHRSTQIDVTDPDLPFTR
jgi:cell division protein FtsQ